MDNNVTNTVETKKPPTPPTTSSSPGTVTADTLPSQELELSPSSQQQQQQSSATTNNSNNNTEQKRPMNAFLLFCKSQRSSVREKYPNLENRGITKILADWWSKLDKEQKSKYTDLARREKEAFMKAHPDFKWCKTPNVSNINNNVRANNTNDESNSNSSTNQQQHQTQSVHQPMDVGHHSSNGMDIMLMSRQQLEAPKPPKKRFLERNEMYGTDVVPYISFDQDTLNRVVDKIFSEDSSSNMCKSSNRTPTNLTSTSGNNPTSINYTTNTDEPVDFSMNRTFNTTRQEIIDNLVEKMLSDVKRTDPDET